MKTKNKLTLLLIPAIFLIGCGETNEKTDNFDIPENGSNITLNEAKNKLSNTFKAMDSIDALGMKVENATLKLTNEVIENNTLTSKINLGIEDFNLNVGLKGLKSATNFNGLEASLSTSLKLAMEATGTDNSSANVNENASLALSAYLKNSNIYVDASDENLLTLIKDLTGLELPMTKFYTSLPIDTSSLEFPLLKDGTLETYFDEIYTKIDEALNKTGDYDGFVSTFITCKTYNNNEWGVKIDVNKENFRDYYKKLIEEDLNPDMSEEEKENAINEYLSFIDKSFEQTGFDHVKAGIVFNDKQLTRVYVDAVVGNYSSSIGTANGEVTHSEEEKTRAEIKAYVNFLYNDEVEMDFTPFKDFQEFKLN